MPLDAEKLHVMLSHQCQKFLPKVLVLYGFLGGIAPFILFPAFVPLFAEAVGNVSAVRENLNSLSIFVEGFKCLDDCGQLHAVVGGIRLTAEHLLLVFAKFQNGTPAAGVLAALIS